MIIAVDFDGTCVEQGPYDATTPLVLVDGALEALHALKRAGHVLLLWSARANRALLFNPMLDPLVRAGVRRVNLAKWEQARKTHVDRYKQMVEFVEREMPGIFDAIDDGAAGKPDVDGFVDDRAVRLGSGPGAEGWREVAQMYGALFEEAA